MSVYKVTVEARIGGFLFDKVVSGVELYEAPNITAAKKMAEKEIEKIKREADYDFFSNTPIILIKDIQKVE